MNFAAVAGRARDFWSLSKPRVVMLIAFTAGCGAALAALRYPVSPLPMFLALCGITLTAAAAAAFNCLVEARIDSAMKRTQGRPLPGGRLGAPSAAMFSALTAAAGLWLTARYGGVLAAVLTAATFFGYAVIYTMCLKRATPQNIVIGGAAGAMPPALGWAAAADSLTYEPLLLFLIIFIWTPPHFWALAICRRDDYAQAGLPMLPVTHGKAFAAGQIVLYAVALLAASLLPFAAGMSGWPYLIVAAALGGRFLWLSLRVQKTLSDSDCRRLFAFSVLYLALLFAALLIDAFAAAWLA